MLCRANTDLQFANSVVGNQDIAVLHRMDPPNCRSVTTSRNVVRWLIVEDGDLPGGAEHKIQNEDRFLRGLQIAFPIHEYFWVKDTHEF